jgi:serine/threonine protein kinase
MSQPARLDHDSEADTHLPLAGTPETFSAVVAIVERFVAAWQTRGIPPAFAAYLPEAGALRRVVLLELIRCDLEQRGLRGLPLPRLAEYAGSFPEATAEPWPVELVLTEFQVRRAAGLPVDVEAFAHDYSAHAAELRAADLSAERNSTLIAHPGAAGELDDIDVGQSVHDFDLLAGLGRGAFARVFLARQRSLQRLVAVKVSHIRGSEPQTLAQLDHDHIVRVFDQHELPDRKLRLLYMQYVAGGTLDAVARLVRATPLARRDGRLLLAAIDAALEARGETRPADSSTRSYLAQLSWPEVVAWLGVRIARALDYAARRGVLHRDVKPANVLLTADGAPKLADFNISFSSEVQGTNPSASFGGSLNYMSPEQLAACHPSLGGAIDRLDGRSDLFSLGVLLWEVLTGNRPYRGIPMSSSWRGTVADMLELRRRPIEPEFLAELPVNCPATLRRVLLRCLDPDPDQRWSNGQELAVQLELCLDPDARALVDPPPSSWRYRLRTWRLPFLIFAVLGPNGLAAAYNYHHNRQRIVLALSPQAIERFEWIQTVVNGIAFPLGVGLSIYLSRRVLSIAPRLRPGVIPDPQTLAAARVDTLRMASRTVGVCLALWVLAGITYPIAMHFAAGGMPRGSHLHFLGSLVVCGLIATAYPFFVIANYAVRSLYPELIPYGLTAEPDGTELRRLQRRSSLWLALAASVPLLAIAGLTLVVRRDVPAELSLMRGLCLGGMIGFGAAYWLSRRLDADIAALQRVLRKLVR